MDNKLKISKKAAMRGEDGYKVFSIRIREDLVDKLDDLSRQTNRSRNEVVSLLLEFGLENCEITE